MRTKPFVLVACLFAGSVCANMIPLTDFRSVAVSGVAGGQGGSQSYSKQQGPSAPFAQFDGNVSGSADWKDPASTSWYGLTGSYHADSRASQTSTITADQIAVTANLWGSSRVSLAGPYGPASSLASSMFEVSFGVLTPLEYQLDAFRTSFFPPTPVPTFDFFLSSASSGTILSSNQPFGTNQFSGTLLPDVYTLRFNAGLSTGPDPLGDFKFAAYGMNFSVAAVPDAGSSVTLFVIALAGLIAVHRKVTSRARVTG
jgi:hypothetical protein